MSDPVQLIPEKIHLAEFKILRAQINSPLELKEKLIKVFHSQVSLELAFNLKKRLVKAVIQVSVESERTEKSVMADTFFQIAYFFEVENMVDLVKEVDDKKMEIHPYLANAIASITYSTTRGILLTRLQGTVFRSFILPVINPNSLLE